MLHTKMSLPVAQDFLNHCNKVLDSIVHKIIRGVSKGNGRFFLILR